MKIIYCYLCKFFGFSNSTHNISISVRQPTLKHRPPDLKTSYRSSIPGGIGFGVSADLFFLALAIDRQTAITIDKDPNVPPDF
jgi:pantoate kinase